MMQKITDQIRVLVDSALENPAGDRYRPVKLLREVLGTANDLAGRPFCTAEELGRRRARHAASRPAGPAAAAREAAPVMVYFDGQDPRTLAKVKELLIARDIPFQVLDCTDDEATRSWATTAARAHEFPLVFVAGEPVGGLHELTQLDVNGVLQKRVFGG